MKLLGTNWAPTEISIGFFMKYSARFCARFFCRQQPDTNKPEELTKFKIGAFNYSIGLHQNDFNDKFFWQEG